MLMTRQNLKQGRPLQGFPIHADEVSGRFGYKLGYCSHCNEPILIRTLDAREFSDRFGISDHIFKTKFVDKLKNIVRH